MPHELQGRYPDKGELGVYQAMLDTLKHYVGDGHPFTLDTEFPDDTTAMIILRCDRALLRSYINRNGALRPPGPTAYTPGPHRNGFPPG